MWLYISGQNAFFRSCWPPMRKQLFKHLNKVLFVCLFQVSDRLVHKNNGSQFQASFKSTSRRIDFTRQRSSAPAPCQYTINDSQTKESVKVPQGVFKSTTERQMIRTPPAVSMNFCYASYTTLLRALCFCTLGTINSSVVFKTSRVQISNNCE